jgi:hypothetical protein
MDVAHLKKHGYKETYIFYVDSQFRDKNMYPTPSQYSITFDSPFKNVYALEILDASIPRTQYSIDIHNNMLVLFYGSGTDSEYIITIPPSDYSDVQLIEEINKQFGNNFIDIEIQNVSDPGDKKNTFRFISRTEFILNMYKSTIRTELGFDEYVKYSDLKVLYDIGFSNDDLINLASSQDELEQLKIENKQYFKSIQTIEIDPIKYNAFNAFNQKSVDSNNYVSNSSIYILNQKSESDLQPDKALYQKFTISSETDGVYGYLSKIQIYTANNVGNIKFSIAVMSMYTNSEGVIVYKKLRLGNTETVEIDNGERIGVWTAPTEYNTDISDIDFLTPGEYFLFIYNVVKNEEPDKGQTCSLGLETLSNVTNEQGFKILDSISFSIGNQMNGIINDSYNTIFTVKTELKTILNKYYNDDNPKCFYLTGGGYLENNEAPELILQKGKSYTFQNNSEYDIELYYYLATDETHVDNYEYNKIIESNRLGYDLDFDLSKGIVAQYVDGNINLTLSDTMDTIQLYYASPNYTYAGNVININNISTVTHPTPAKSLAFTIETKENPYTVTAPGVYSLIGDRYTILRCPEIEQHLYRSRAFERYTMGLGKFKLAALGYDNQTSMDFSKIPMREFHPIGKLTQMSFRFERPDGQLYNFKGINHTLTFAIKYYEPSEGKQFTNYQLNPNYNPNFMEYIQNQESTDESDYESDNESD